MFTFIHIDTVNVVEFSYNLAEFFNYRALGNMMKIMTLSAVAVALLTLVACSSEETESSNVKTAAIWVDMKVDSNGERSRVVAELNVSGATGTNVVLSSEDSLVVSAGGQSKTLQKDTDFLDVDYQGYLNVVSGETVFTITLNRKNETNATSTVALPASFAIHAPLSSDVYMLAQNINIDWDGLANDTMATLGVTSYCKDITGADLTQFHSVEISDDGQYDLVPNSLDMFKNTQVDFNKDCRLDIAISRKTSGQTASSFKRSSKIIAKQHRSVKNIKINN